jgi:hypothetical protein
MEQMNHLTVHHNILRARATGKGPAIGVKIRGHD